jgi:hypothetical protein
VNSDDLRYLESHELVSFGEQEVLRDPLAHYDQSRQPRRRV